MWQGQVSKLVKLAVLLRANIKIRGAYNHTNSSECIFEHWSSDVWTILRCMDEPYIGALAIHRRMVLPWIYHKSSHTLEPQPYIGAPMYGCPGTLQWAPIWVFLRLPRCQWMGTNIRSPKLKTWSIIGRGNKNECSPLLNKQMIPPYYTLLQGFREAKTSCNLWKQED